MGVYDLAKSLFLQALELPEAEREEFVRSQTGGMDEVQREVRALLSAHAELAQGAEFDEHEPLPDSISGFEVRGELGRGGMGLVLRAARPGEPEVALKLLRDGWLSPSLLARFRREAEALRRLDHTGIARFIDSGVEESGGKSRPWLAMELIQGETLRQWAGAERTLEERLALMAAVADAVDHAHQRGIVHRDLKPENILVRPGGQPVVLDFGVARLAESDVRATTIMTSVGVLVGTIRYMSPEQADANPDTIGPRSDVHALAVLTCELLTGRLPFEVPENSVHRALVAVMTHPPRPLLELPVRLRAPLERVLDAALAKDPADRTESAAAFAADLRRVIAGRRPLASPRPRRVRWANLPVPVWFGLVSAGVLMGALVAASRRAPTPLDFLLGTAQPRRQFVRIRTDIDSAMVRIHSNTRTNRGLAEALERVVHAGALLETVKGQPWHAQVSAFQRYREGEARYLIAERGYDPAGYEQAAAAWVASSEHLPLKRVAMPDTVGILASLYGGGPFLGQGAAAMALEDRARLMDRLRSLERAARLRAEGVAAALPGAGDLAVDAPGADSTTLARWRAGNGANEVALAVQRGEGLLVDAASLSHGLELLRRAEAEPSIHEDGSSHASLLHDLGMAHLWTAVAGDMVHLDSARTILAEARSIRSQMPGYTSVVHSACALADAERLLAWRTLDPVRARGALARAEAALEVRETEDVQLMPMDRAMLDLARASVLVDLGCIERDSSRFSTAWSLLNEVSGRIDDRRAPRLAMEGLLVRFRIEAQRAAIAPAPVHGVRLRSLGDQLVRLESAAGDVRLMIIAGRSRDAIGRIPPAPFALTYPQPVPF